MARFLKGSHSFTCTVHTLPSSANGMNHRLPAFAFPAEAGTHIPTPEGWKAELALMCRFNTHFTAILIGVIVLYQA